MEGVCIPFELHRRQFKVCLIGDGFVGKTSIRRSFLGSVFKRSYIATLGVDFAQKTFVMGKTPIYLLIWDIAGQPLFQGLRRRYYEGCSGLLLTYSVVNRESFDNASKWLVEAHGFMGELPPLIIIGNKIDLRPSHPVEETVSYEEGQAFTKRFGEKMNTPSIFIETSALTGENIDKAFESLTEMMIDEADGRPVKSEHVQLRVDRPTAIDEGVNDTGAATPRTETVRPGADTGSIGSTESSDVEASEPTSQSAARMQVADYLSSVQEPIADERSVREPPAEILNLHAELKRAESELSNVTSDLNTALLNLKNTVHVKRIMYEHLKRQLRETRQEWSDAYDDYVRTNQRKKAELDKRNKEIAELRERIRKAERSRSQ
ncbi:MAG: GTP-binding protein [Candidatus Thorarchaeota archaeon]|jgi:small GTP-binding protein